MSAAAARVIGCPFCGLACDDLRIDGGAVDTRGCAKAAARFAAPGAARQHRIGGKAASFEQAVAAAGAILSKARLPLITGLATDLTGIRGLLALADRAGAVIDRWRSGAQLANLDVVQRAGAITATFGEIANRADAVLLLGCDPMRDYPRLIERLLSNSKALYREVAPAVIYLGPAGSAPAGVALAALVPVEPPGLLEALSALAAFVDDRRIGGGTGTALPLEALGTLAERFKQARYGAILWDTAHFAADQAVPAVTLLLHILRSLNRKTRCVGLPLGGSDNAQGVAQAMLWQAGWPARLSFAGGAPEYDPWRFDAERLLAAGEVDALFWVGAISPTPPPAVAVPTVALVAPQVELLEAPAVEIRIGVPGLDHGGTVLRTDTVIAVPLAAARPTALPSVGMVAAAILERLGAAS